MVFASAHYQQHLCSFAYRSFASSVNVLEANVYNFLPEGIKGADLGDSFHQAPMTAVLVDSH